MRGLHHLRLLSTCFMWQIYHTLTMFKACGVLMRLPYMLMAPQRTSSMQSEAAAVEQLQILRQDI